MRSIKERVILFFKGMAMGAADVVPGVSGGTIAFISGIYEELIESIKSIGGKALLVLKNEGIPSFWRHINGNFLLSVFLGVFVSIATLARVITFLLANYPIIVWAFFFGLIIGSVYFVAKRVLQWNAFVIVAGLAAIVVAYLVTVLVPAETTDALWFVFLSGFIAICAMILPGISGSFILLLMGKYEFIMNSIREFNITVIGIFLIGCVGGIISFSHVIAWLFKRYHDLTVAILAGFMIGSLNKVWPWKEVLETRINSKGEEVPFLERSISPFLYEEITGHDHMLGWAILAAFAGIILIVAFEKLSETKKKVEA